MRHAALPVIPYSGRDRVPPELTNPGAANESGPRALLQRRAWRGAGVHVDDGGRIHPDFLYAGGEASESSAVAAPRVAKRVRVNVEESGVAVVHSMAEGALCLRRMGTWQGMDGYGATSRPLDFGDAKRLYPRRRSDFSRETETD